MDNENLAKYQYFIRMITEKISDFFENQKEYIECKHGCSLCCEEGQYPFLKIEFEYLKMQYQLLPHETRQIIDKQIIELVNDYRNKKNNNEEYLYKCPFLLNGSCSVYEHRGIICRTFGLITQNAKGDLTIPFCCQKGLNYSKVYDFNKKIISEEKVKELKYKEFPNGYNLNVNNLIDIAKDLNIDFGEYKPLIEWLDKLVNDKNN